MLQFLKKKQHVHFIFPTGSRGLDLDVHAYGFQAAEADCSLAQESAKDAQQYRPRVRVN
jgi:hypothetical protein